MNSNRNNLIKDNIIIICTRIKVCQNSVNKMFAYNPYGNHLTLIKLIQCLVENIIKKCIKYNLKNKN
jgi:hypothetical protein